MPRLLKFFFQFLLLTSFVTILINNPYVYNSPSYNSHHFLFAIIIISISVLLFLVEAIYSRKNYGFTAIDTMLTLILAWILVSRLLTFSGQPFLSESIFCIIVMANLYVIGRLVLTVRSFAYGLSAVLCMQVAMACIQLYDNYESRISHLFLTGTLGNSGLLSGFIVMISSCVFFLIRKSRPVYIYSVVVIVGIFLLMTQSRAALLAFIPVVYLSRRDAHYGLYKKLPIWLWTVCLLLIAGALTILRQPSAFGRLLIWKITVKNSFESFLTGVGFGRFPKEYQQWHIDYIIKHQNNLTGFSATDLPNNCFNEPLQIFTETGFVGLMLWLFLSIAICRMNSGLQKSQRALFASILTSFFIFSLLSYPLHSLPLLGAFVCTLAVLSSVSDRTKLYVSGSLLRYVFTVACLCTIGFLWYAYNKDVAISNWTRLKATKTKGKVSLQYQSAYPYVNENAKFLFDYGTVLYNEKQYVNCIRVLRECKDITSQLDAPLLEGLVLQKMGSPKEAKEVYLNCIYSYPLLIRPKYDLLKLYLYEKDTASAYRMSKIIVNSEVKIHSGEASRMLYDATRIFIQLGKTQGRPDDKN